MLRQQNGDKKIRHKKGGIICRLLRYAVLSCKPDICDIKSLIKTALFALLDDSLNGIELFVGSHFVYPYLAGNVEIANFSLFNDELISRCYEQYKKYIF